MKRVTVFLAIFTFLAVQTLGVCTAWAGNSHYNYYNAGDSFLNVVQGTSGALSLVETDGEKFLEHKVDGVSSEYSWGDIFVNPDKIYADKYTLSFDVSAGQSNQYSYLQIHSASSSDSGNSYTMADLFFSCDGKIGYKTNPDWEGIHSFPDGNDAYSGYNLADINADEWYHIDIVMNSKTGNSAYYLNGKEWGDGAVFTPGYILHDMHITARGAGDYNTAPTGDECFRYDNIVSFSMNESQLCYVMGGVDEIEKSVDIVFSEEPQNSMLNEIEIKSTGSDKEVNIVDRKIHNNTLTLAYSGELESAMEYSVKIPKGIKGIANGVSNEEILYFVTEAGNNEIDWTVYDYTDKSVTFGSDDRYHYVKDVGGVHGNVLALASASLTDIQVSMADVDIPQEENVTISFDVMPLYNNHAIGINLISPENAALGIAFNLNSKLLMGCGWIGEDFIRLSISDIDRWQADKNAGDFNANEWVNIKIENNAKTHTSKFYVNDTYFNSFVSPDNFTYMKDLRIVQYNTTTNVPVGTEQLYIDNIKVGYEKQEDNVKNIRFYDSDGNATGPHGVCGRDISGITINFYSEPDETTLTKDNVKLYYGEKEIDYISAGCDGISYSIIPKELPQKNDKITVRVSNVETTAGGVISEYSTRVKASDEEGSLSIAEFEFKDDFGNSLSDLTALSAYVNSAIYNTSNKSENIIVSVMGYKGERMAYINCIDFDIQPGEVRIFDYSGENSVLNADFIHGCDTVEASILKCDGNRFPLIEKIVLTNK